MAKSKVIFEQDLPPLLYSKFQRSNETPKVIKLMLKAKFIKNEKQALNVALGIVIAFVVAAFVLFVWINVDPSIKTLPVLNLK